MNKEQSKATTQWKMRISPVDKKKIAYVAKCLGIKESKLIRDKIRELYAETVKAECLKTP